MAAFGRPFCFRAIFYCSTLIGLKPPHLVRTAPAWHAELLDQLRNAVRSLANKVGRGRGSSSRELTER